jgi:UDP-N-acetylmuramate dehydrogenase
MMQPRHGLPLAPLTTFGVAGSAATAWTLEHLGQIDPLLDRLARDSNAASPLPFVLGGGSNVLFARDLDEPLVLVRLRGRSLLEDDGASVLLEVGAGEVWDETVRHALARNWFGLENLSLIPGLVGGAPWQNIGAYGVEVAEVIESVAAIDLGSGERRCFDRAACAFEYRGSFFKTDAGRRWLITSVRLRLSRLPRPRTDYGEIQAELAAQATSRMPVADGRPPTDDSHPEPTPQQIAQAVRAIRRRKLPDPQVIGNAGSFFKNPVVPAGIAESLRLSFAKLPVHPVAGDPTRAKLAAGWLIESAGWKGFRDGDAGVSDRHALVLVNHGAATGQQLLALARRIQQSVHEKFGVRLEPEPVIVA